MFDGIVWKTVKQRPTYDREGHLKWLVLERHRLWGHYRTTLVDEQWDAIHARHFTKKPTETEA